MWLGGSGRNGAGRLPSYLSAGMVYFILWAGSSSGEDGLVSSKRIGFAGRDSVVGSGVVVIGWDEDGLVHGRTEDE